MKASQVMPTSEVLYRNERTQQTKLFCGKFFSEMEAMKTNGRESKQVF
jgi:hypothetical protein